MLGYGGRWNKLRTTYYITVPRDAVMQILKEGLGGPMKSRYG